jgi:hypothetical protein
VFALQTHSRRSKAITMPFQRIRVQRIPSSAGVKMDRQITTQSNAPIGGILGFQWVLANVVGWAILGATIGAMDLVGTLLKPRGDAIDWNIVWIGVLAVVLITVGAGVGVVQWFALRRQGRRAGLWMLASLIGWPMSLAVGWAIGRVASGFVVLAALWATAGALLRIMQWFIWRRGAYQTRWWVAAWLVGLDMGWAMGWTVGWIYGWEIGSAVGAAIDQTLGGMTVWSAVKDQISLLSWWILANLVGWAIGRALVEISEWFALRRSGYQQADRWISAVGGIVILSVALGWGQELGASVGLDVGFPGASVVGLVVGWVIVGAIAGSLLFWLSRHPA